MNGARGSKVCGVAPAVLATVVAAGFGAPAPVTGQTPFRVEEPSPEDFPKVGHRYARLSARERTALRPSFRLPMEALFSADSASDLLSAAIVESLPDPGTPLLPAPVNAGAGGDPFSGAAAAEGDAPLGALGRLFLREAEMLAASGRSPAVSRTQPAEAPDPFDSPAEEPPAESAPADDDPFASDDESEEDPFGF